MKLERSLVLIKPDGVQRGLIGRILQRFEDAGIKVVAMKMIWIDREFAAKHYFDVAERRGEQVFKWNTDFIVSGPVVAMALEGVEVIENVRKIVGDTEPKISPPGTIRGDFSHHSIKWVNENDGAIRNLIHASSNAEDAAKELKLWFVDSELHAYKTVHEDHTF